MNIKRILVGIISLVMLYLGSVLIRAYYAEKGAEAYMRQTLIEIAQPWDEIKLESRASWLFREHARLKPKEIVRLALLELGDLSEITKGPDCGLKRQIFPAYSNQAYKVAVCELTAKFKHKTVMMHIRLIEENKTWRLNDFISIE